MESGTRSIGIDSFSSKNGNDMQGIDIESVCFDFGYQRLVSCSLTAHDVNSW
ncbi:hypothetical protein F9C07_3393 [Aspergillus flavus]|uniref:Uncharacterized protein n=1 Tax=Aspergillus flavus (strain ATCC 200026 / FGSC A1120 / IAM 13836 / NRRL 3357 / JCM 12722 / SRRC 167) TaxID=332952 RepID=A0A7U2MTG5_ASPFN|nr:hypothetical protein F9C07_3393 [Aspergillus flavus]